MVVSTAAPAAAASIPDSCDKNEIMSCTTTNTTDSSNAVDDVAVASAKLSMSSNNDCMTNKEDNDDDDDDDDVGGGCSSSNSMSRKSDDVVLTYEGIKNSEGYEKAKACLSDGNFELALETIETELTKIISLLGKEGELHESLAPLYYLYGTTLLYSVEESSSDVQVQPQEDTNDDGEGEEVVAGGDLQIAWENLESARSILTTEMKTSDDKMLDLAQVHMRLGDLQRANGNYRSAISDYTFCLELRKKQHLLYDRRIADSYYSLGMCCLLLAAESDAHQQTPPPTTTSTALSSEQQQTEGGVVWMSKEEILEYREQSILHYLECGRILVGMIAQLCGRSVAEADVVTHVLPVKLPISGTLKPTIAHASQALTTLRSRIASFDNKTTHPEVANWMEMLDEIQETIDNTEQDQEGLRDVKAMKAMAEAQADQQDNDDDDQKKPAASTTIGFAPLTTTATTTTTTNTMMIVKKKKKRTDNPDDNAKPASCPDSKRPKTTEI